MSEQIANAGNTVIPAYLALQSKGYRVWCQRAAMTPNDEIWSAEGLLGRFSAEDAVALLGLVAMREIRGAAWQASDEQIEIFLDMFPRASN